MKCARKDTDDEALMSSGGYRTSAVVAENHQVRVKNTGVWWRGGLGGFPKSEQSEAKRVFAEMIGRAFSLAPYLQQRSWNGLGLT